MILTSSCWMCKSLFSNEWYVNISLHIYEKIKSWIILIFRTPCSTMNCKFIYKIHKTSDSEWIWNLRFQIMNYEIIIYITGSRTPGSHRFSKPCRLKYHNSRNFKFWLVGLANLLYCIKINAKYLNNLSGDTA